MRKSVSNKNRYHTLDELRGFAILCMVVYHALYTMVYVLNVTELYKIYNFFTPAQPYFAAFFIFLSGIACSFSRSNLKRGLKLLGIAVAISVVTLFLSSKGFGGVQIYFGILHLLAVCMILASLFIPYMKKGSKPLGIMLMLFLFFITYNIELGYIGINPVTLDIPNSFYATNYLMPFGIYKLGFVSADYFPIFPWAFMFFAGVFVGFYEKTGKFPKFLKKRRISFLSYLGRNTLIIYILHQPVIYLLSTIVIKIFNL